MKIGATQKSSAAKWGYGFGIWSGGLVIGYFATYHGLDYPSFALGMTAVFGLFVAGQWHIHSAKEDNHDG